MRVYDLAARGRGVKPHVKAVRIGVIQLSTQPEVHALRKDHVQAVVVRDRFVVEVANVAEVLIRTPGLDCARLRERRVHLPARIQVIGVVALILHVDAGVVPEARSADRRVGEKRRSIRRRRPRATKAAGRNKRWPGRSNFAALPRLAT
jgi:hypothetical protein